MSLSRIKRPVAARRRIDLKAAAQVKSLSRHLGITPVELARTVDKVGPSMTAIKKEVLTTKL